MRPVVVPVVAAFVVPVVAAVVVVVPVVVAVVVVVELLHFVLFAMGGMEASEESSATFYTWSASAVDCRPSRDMGRGAATTS